MDPSLFDDVILTLLKLIGVFVFIVTFIRFMLYSVSDLLSRTRSLLSQIKRTDSTIKKPNRSEGSD